jgi:DNA-binding NtrC family response regulator
MASMPSKQFNEVADAGLNPFGEDGHVRSLLDIEAEIIGVALERYGGCLSRVARHLKIGRTTVYRKVEVANWVKERRSRKQM